MSIYNDLARKLDEHGVQRRGALREVIDSAEREIGLLPEDYCQFLLDFGWAEIGHHEIYGLGPGVPHYLDVVAMTKAERIQPGVPVPPTFVPVMNDGGGNLYCLSVEHTRKHRDSPIFFWSHEDDVDQSPDEMGPSFGAWLLDEIEALDAG